jgi:hypothetical protein
MIDGKPGFLSTLQGDRKLFGLVEIHMRCEAAKQNPEAEGDDKEGPEPTEYIARQNAGCAKKEQDAKQDEQTTPEKFRAAHVSFLSAGGVEAHE